MNFLKRLFSRKPANRHNYTPMPWLHYVMEEFNGPCRYYNTVTATRVRG